MSVNTVFLIGFLGGNPEIKTNTAGKKVATFSLATSEKWRDKAPGERKEATQWHRIVVFNESAVSFAEQYLKKGSQALVEGSYKSRKYTATGGEREVFEVVVSAFRGGIVGLDKAERAPVPDADAYGGAGGAADDDGMVA